MFTHSRSFRINEAQTQCAIHCQCWLAGLLCLNRFDCRSAQVWLHAFSRVSSARRLRGRNPSSTCCGVSHFNHEHVIVVTLCLCRCGCCWDELLYNSESMPQWRLYGNGFEARVRITCAETNLKSILGNKQKIIENWNPAFQKNADGILNIWNANLKCENCTNYKIVIDIQHNAKYKSKLHVGSLWTERHEWF